MDDEDPLTPEQRQGVQQALEELVEQDRAFLCGLCGNYVAVDYEVAHSDWHDKQ